MVLLAPTCAEWRCDVTRGVFPTDRSRALPHSSAEVPNRSWSDSDTGYAHRPLLNIVLRPSPKRGRNRPSESVATHDCTRDTVLGGAVASGVPHPLMGERCSLGSVESPCATRRCRAPSGTASPDAVPQMRSYRSHSPRAGQRSLSRHSSGTLL